MEYEILLCYLMLILNSIFLEFHLMPLLTKNPVVSGYDSIILLKIVIANHPVVYVSVKALAWIDNWHLFLKILAFNQAFKNMYFIKLKCLFYSRAMTLFMSLSSMSSFSGLHGHGSSLQS